MGLEFAGSIVGMVLVGWGIDTLAGTGRLWTMILGIVGIIGGGYNFIKRARMYMKAQEAAYRSSQDARRAAIAGRDLSEHDTREQTTPDARRGEQTEESTGRPSKQAPDIALPDRPMLALGGWSPRPGCGARGGDGAGASR